MADVDPVETLVAADVEQGAVGYRKNMIPRSRAHQAAAAGDIEAALVQPSDNRFFLPAITMDLTHSLQQAEAWRERLKTHGAGIEGTPAYRSMAAAGRDYTKDYELLERANRHYNFLVPQAQLTVRSHERLEGIKRSLPAEVSMSIGLEGHEPGVAKGLEKNKDVKNNGNVVGQAAGALTKARGDLNNATEFFNAWMTGQLLNELQAQLDSAKANRQAVIDRINKVVGYVDVVGSLAGGAVSAAGMVRKAGEGPPTGQVYGPDGKPIGSVNDPNKVETDDVRRSREVEAKGGAVQGGANLVSKVVSFGMQLFNAHTLDELEKQIGSITETIGTWKDIQASQLGFAIKGQFSTAKEAYATASAAYMSAIDQRRRQYADLGTDATVAEQGAKGAKANDGVAQYMLLASAYQEHEQILLTAIAAATDADTAVRAAWKHIQHRTQEITIPGFSHWYGEGLDTQDAVALDEATRNASAFKQAATESAETAKSQAGDARAALSNIGNAVGGY